MSELGRVSLIATASASLALAACGGGTDSAPPPVSIGGTVSGLAGSGLVLTNNGVDALNVAADGAFAFATPVASGTPYSIAVRSQPAAPSQTCTVTNGSGTANRMPVANITVACITNRYTVGGTVSGLTGNGLVLQNNGGDDLVIAANATFRFATAIESGKGFRVTVATQPGDGAEHCTVTAGEAALTIASFDNVRVQCSPAGRFLFVATASEGFGPCLAGTPGKIQIYRIDASARALIEVPGSPYVIPEIAGVIAPTPDGHYAFAAASGTACQPADSRIHAFAVNATTGALSPVVGSPFAIGDVTGGAIVDPTGRRLYIAGSGGVGMRGYAIDPKSGALSKIPGGPYAPSSAILAIDPSARLLYAQVDGRNEIVAFAIDPSSGALLAGPVTALPADVLSVDSMEIDSEGRFAYVEYYPLSGILTRVAYSIAPGTGALLPKAGSVFADGMDRPGPLATDPMRPQAHVAACGAPLAVRGGPVCTNAFFTFQVDAASGDLIPDLARTSYPGSETLADARLIDFRIDPSGKFGCTHASLFTPNSSRRSWITCYARDATAGTFATTVTEWASPAGEGATAFAISR